MESIPPPDLPAQWEIAGLVAAFFPFICSFSTSSTSTSTVNGVVVESSSSSTDFVAMGAGALACVLAVYSINALSSTPRIDRMKRIGLILLIGGVGLYQLLRGFGAV